MLRRPLPSFSRLDGEGLLFDHWMTANLISVNYGAAEREKRGKNEGECRSKKALRLTDDMFNCAHNMRLS